MAQIAHDDSIVDVIIIPSPLMKRDKAAPLEEVLQQFGNDIHIHKILEIAAGVYDIESQKMVSGTIITLSGSIDPKHYHELKEFLGNTYPGSYMRNGAWHTQES